MADIATGVTTATLWDDACAHFGQRRFLVYLDASGRRAEYTYAGFAARIHQAAHAFRAVGIGQDDLVTLQVHNSPEMLVAMFGLMELGAVAVPLSPAAAPTEMLRAHRASGARWAVVEDCRLDDLLTLRGEHGIADLGVVVVEEAERASDRPRSAGVQSLAAICAHQPIRPVGVPLRDDAVAEVLYTSGTTAAPKGVMITHANLVFSGHYGVWQLSLRDRDRLLTTMPACHSNLQLGALMPVLVAGATLVLVEKYSASRFWQQVRDERASVVQLIAMMVRTLLLQPPSPRDGVHQVREASYFMPISDTEKDDFERRFALRLMNSYGSTESIAWAVTDPPVGARRWPSVGRAGLGYEVAIFDDQGRELPAGTVGEFRIKGTPGRSLMLGYYRDPEATQAALTPDGWLRTGDQGVVDDEGWFSFIDRSANVIKRGGENIATAEVECVLTSHPEIAEAAVIGVPDPVRDQGVKAFVWLQPGSHLTADQIIAYCCTHLTSFKVPQYIEMVQDFPRTSSMKIEKRCLHD